MNAKKIREAAELLERLDSLRDIEKLVKAGASFSISASNETNDFASVDLIDIKDWVLINDIIADVRTRVKVALASLGVK